MTKRIYHNDIVKLQRKIIMDERFNEAKISRLTKMLDKLESEIDYYINGA